MEPDHEQMHALVRALFTVVRRMKQLPGQATDQSTVFLLAQVATTEPVRMSDLAGHCGLDLSTVSRGARQLVDRGLLARGDDPDDRRASQLALTPAGRAVLDEAMERRADALGAALSTWSPDDCDALLALLGRLAHDLSAAIDRSEPR